MTMGWVGLVVYYFCKILDSNAFFFFVYSIQYASQLMSLPLALRTWLR